MTGTRRKTTDAPHTDASPTGAAGTGTPEEDPLSTSPFEGDLAADLKAEPRPRRRPPSVTVLLGAAVLVVGGFAGGVQADKHWGAKPSTDPANLLQQLAAGRTGGQGGAGGLGGFGGFGGGQSGAQGGGAQGGARAAGAGTSGTVKLVDGDVIYVQTPNGIVRVKTTGSTKVTLARKATAKALKAGTTVTVQGTPAQDGTVTATSVRGG